MPKLSNSFLAAALISHFCSVANAAAEGELVCWGGPYGDIEVEIASPPPGFIVKDYDKEGTMVCAISMDDRLHCWGKRMPPNKMDYAFDYLSRYPGHVVAKAISMDSLAACYIDENDQPACWGDNVGDMRLATVGRQYVDLVVAEGGLCAWTKDGDIDCNFGGGVLSGRKIEELSVTDGIPCFVEKDVPVNRSGFAGG